MTVEVVFRRFDSPPRGRLPQPPRPHCRAQRHTQQRQQTGRAAPARDSRAPHRGFAGVVPDGMQQWGSIPLHEEHLSPALLRLRGITRLFVMRRG